MKKSKSDIMAEQMMEYLRFRLKAGGQEFYAIKKNFPDKNIRDFYCLIGEPGAILLVNEQYTKAEFRKIWSKFQLHSRQAFQKENKELINCFPIFYKDGKTYFRSAVSGKNDLNNVSYIRSLSRYKPEQKINMINFTPPEKIMCPEKGRIIYYQPKSARLEEMVVSYDFKPVLYDRQLRPEQKPIYPEKENSRKLFIWTYKWEHRGAITVANNRIQSVKEIQPQIRLSKDW